MSHPGDVSLFQFLIKNFSIIFNKAPIRLLGQCLWPVLLARKSLPPYPAPPAPLLVFLAFSFVLFLPSGFLGMIQARLVNARPARPPHPPAPFSSFLAFSFVLFFSSGWLGGIQARLVNARPNTPSPPGRKRREKRKKKNATPRYSCLDK